MTEKKVTPGAKELATVMHELHEQIKAINLQIKGIHLKISFIEGFSEKLNRLEERMDSYILETNTLIKDKYAFQGQVNDGLARLDKSEKEQANLKSNMVKQDQLEEVKDRIDEIAYWINNELVKKINRLRNK